MSEKLPQHHLPPPLPENFRYKQGVLHVEEVSLESLAAQYGTPLFCYSRAQMEHNYRAYAAHTQLPGIPTKIHYAMKANFNLAIVAILNQCGAGMDVVCENEIAVALRAGVKAQDIVFSGVAKTPEAIEFALHEGIKQFNVEKPGELALINAIAGRMKSSGALAQNFKMRTALRVNPPGVSVDTNEKIKTVGENSKFGMSLEAARQEFLGHAHQYPHLDMQGVSIHIGSQVLALSAFVEAFTALSDFVDEIQSQGVSLKSIDLGGGIGVPYTREDRPLSLSEYQHTILNIFGDMKHTELLFEPGRFLIANAGVLVGRVHSVEQEGATRRAIVDCGMTDNPRSAMYDAWHPLWPMQEKECAALFRVDDQICESSGTFFDHTLPADLGVNDGVVMGNTGAYCASMASNYNCRTLSMEVLVDGKDTHVLRKRQTVEELCAPYILPPFLLPEPRCCE